MKKQHNCTRNLFLEATVTAKYENFMMCMDLSLYCKSQDELLENIQPQLISKSSDSASISQENEICLRNSDCVSLKLPITTEDNDNNSEVEDNDSVDNNVRNVKNRQHFGMNKQRSSSLQDLTGCTSVWNQGVQSRTTPRLVSSESKDSGLPLSSSCASLCSGEKNCNSSVKDRVKSNYVREPCIDILYRELEEKDAMLEKLQEKYNELLVLYAESRNMIDKLRCHSCNENVDKPFETSKDWKRFSFSSQLSDLTINNKQNYVSDHISDRPLSICRKPSTDSLQSVSSSSESSVSKVQRWQHSWSSNSTDDCIPQIDQNMSDNSDTESIVSTPPLQSRSECVDSKPDIPLLRNVTALEEQLRCEEEKTEVNDHDSSKKHSAEENNVLLFLTRVEECAKQLHAQSVAVKKATVSLCQKQL